MVGLPYDYLANPLGAVRLTFEKAVSSGLNPSTSDGSDWGVVDVFNNFLFEDNNLSQVPILNAKSVQDMLGNEFYAGSYKYAHRKCIQKWCNEKGDIICEICHQVVCVLGAYDLGVTAQALGMSALYHNIVCIGAVVYVIGSPQKLGQWKTEGGLKLSYAGDSVWQADCLMGKEDFPIKYRYGKYDKAGKFSIEIGSNRELSVETSSSKARYIFLSDGMLRVRPLKKH